MDIKRCVLLLTLTLASMGCVEVTTDSPAGDETAVRATSEQFYDALNAIFHGDLAPMEEVWSHADDVTYMGPAGGIQVGWEQVRANWRQQAEMKLGGKVTPGAMHIAVSDSLAVVGNIEKGENVADGKAVEVSIRATTTLRRESGEWKVIGHHTDLLPFLSE